MFWCSNIQMFKHSNVQNVHMHRDSSGRGVRSNWWFWIGVCGALLVSAATDQGTPLLGRILLLRLFSHLILFQEPVFRIIFYILSRAALCLCLQKNFFLGRDKRIFTWLIHRSMHVTLLFCVFHLNWGRGIVCATCLRSRHIFSFFFCIKFYLFTGSVLVPLLPPVKEHYYYLLACWVDFFLIFLFPKALLVKQEHRQFCL